MTALKPLIVGLDLGTNNTYMSVIEEGNKNPTFIKSATGHDLHGTYVYYPETKGEKPIFGIPALEMIPNRNVIRLPKKALGAHAKRFTNYGVFNAEVANPGKQAPIKFKITIKDDKGADKTIHKTGKDVIVDLLKHFKEVASVHLDGREIQWVVSKPMYWNGNQAKVYKEALAEAGIQPLAVLPEPTAAMFCYRAKTGKDNIGQTTSVIDVGAGTTDCVLQEDLGDGNYLNRCVGGDDMLGSSNMDDYLLDALKEEMQKQPNFSQDEFDAQIPENREKMKQLKHRLSTLPKGSVRISGVTPKPFVFEVDQVRKREIFQPFYQKLEAVIMDMFKRSAAASNKKYTADQIRESVKVVAMVGGGSKDTTIGDEILPKIFPSAQIVGRPNQKDSVNPDLAVSMGNTYWGAALTGTETVKGLPPNPVNAPTLSQDLGVESVGGYGTPNMIRWFCSVIDANTSIPTTGKKDEFTTVKDNQEGVLVEVYQGIGKKTTDDGVTFLGRYEVPVEVPNKAGKPNIEVEMEVFADSTIVVRAGEKGKEKKELTVKDVNL